MNKQYTDIGSDELTDDEFKQYAARDTELLDILNERVTAGDETTALLNSPFGKEIRKTLVAQKVVAMRACAEAIGTSEQEMRNARLNYDVVCRVESIFGHILVGKNEALKELKYLTQNHGDY